MAVETLPADIHRLSAEEYHRLIEAGGFDVPIELIEGLLVDMSPKTPAHEQAIAWLLKRLFLGIDLDRYEVRVAAPLSLGDSEPEPDLMVLEHGVQRPYHPATAALVVEIAVSSQRRDLRVKPRLYARAGVPEYWVIDLDGRRAVTHSRPEGEAYAQVTAVAPDGELTAPHLDLAPVPLADVLAAAEV